jgi:hypothetical protein
MYFEFNINGKLTINYEIIRCEINFKFVYDYDNYFCTYLFPGE